MVNKCHWGEKIYFQGLEFKGPNEYMQFDKIDKFQQESDKTFFFDHIKLHGIEK